MLDTIDPRDVVYTIVGLALFGLTLESALSRYRIVNLPALYVLLGALAGWLGLAEINPLKGGWQTSVVEHASELIVIISLAGAGLAIDTLGSWRNWKPTWWLLIIAMPLTIAAVGLSGFHILSLSVPGALLLAASLAPTDPVLARSVQVSPPGQDEEPMQVALTAEAGMNDGLAFPFVYLSIHAAVLGAGQMTSGEIWLLDWIGFDVFYRITVGLGVGYAVGWVVSKIIFSSFGDGSQGAWNAVVVILSATLLSYGIAEAADGYGFLAVFVAMRAGRSNSRGTDGEGYEKYAHHGAEQLEAILLAVLLLWLGTFISAGALEGLVWAEVAFAVVLICVIRPAAGLLALLMVDCDRISRFNVAFFGIRGMGTVFYIAYAQTHAEFSDIDAVWRIAVLTILLSIIIHGYAANFMLKDETSTADRRHPLKSEGRSN